MSSWKEFLEPLIARIVCDLLERGIERTPEEVTDAFAFALLDVAAFADKAQRNEFSLRPLVNFDRINGESTVQPETRASEGAVSASVRAGGRAPAQAQKRWGARLYKPACGQLRFDAMGAGLGLGNDECRQAGRLACVSSDRRVERA